MTNLDSRALSLPYQDQKRTLLNTQISSTASWKRSHSSKIVSLMMRSLRKEVELRSPLIKTSYQKLFKQQIKANHLNSLSSKRGRAICWMISLKTNAVKTMKFLEIALTKLKFAKKDKLKVLLLSIVTMKAILLICNLGKAIAWYWSNKTFVSVHNWIQTRLCNCAMSVVDPYNSSSFKGWQIRLIAILKHN